MTTFFIITSIVLGTLVLAGLKDRDKKLTPFQQEREDARHFHY